MEPYCTVGEALGYLQRLYAQDECDTPVDGRHLNRAFKSLHIAALKGDVRISGCRCKCLAGRISDIGEREIIEAIKWDDLVLKYRSGDLGEEDWSALNRYQERIKKTQPLAGLDRASDGWCRLRVNRLDLFAAFPERPTADAEANLAWLRTAATEPLPSQMSPIFRSLSRKAFDPTKPLPRHDGTMAEAKGSNSPVVELSTEDHQATSRVDPILSEPQPRPKRPRREKGHWVLAEPVALAWLQEEGEPAELGDQAKLEGVIRDFLAAKDIHPVTSTIREHVVRWISQFKESKVVNH